MCNGLAPVRNQAIIQIKAGLLLNRPWGAYFHEILFDNLNLSIKKTPLS